MNAAVTRASTPPLASDGDSASNKDIREHPGEEGGTLWPPPLLYSRHPGKSCFRAMKQLQEV